MSWSTNISIISSKINFFNIVFEKLYYNNTVKKITDFA